MIAGAENSKVILVGREYGGALAVWFRQKYPHLVQGAWAARSAVLAKLNFYEYKERAGADFREIAGNACYDALEAGFTELEAIAVAGNYSELDRLMNVCDNHYVESENDVSILFLSLSEFFTSVTQM